LIVTIRFATLRFPRALILGLAWLGAGLLPGGLLPWTVAGSEAAGQDAAGMRPMAVVAISSYEALMGDLDFLGGLGGMPAASQLVEMGVMQATQNQGLKGFDKTKPLGLIVQTDDSGMFAGSACLPVTDLAQLLEVLAPFGVDSQDAGNGVTQISSNGQNLFAKTGGGWAFMSIMPHMLESVPADPGSVLKKLTNDYDLALQLNVQNVPEAYRQLAIDAMASGANESLQQQSEESDEDFAVRKQQMEMQLEELKRVVQEMDELTLGISIDSQQQRTFLDINYTAVPNSKLAQDFALNANPSTNFAGFFEPDAAMMMTFASKVSPADVAQLDQMLDAVRQQASKAIDKESDLPSDNAKTQVKSALDDILAAVKATMQAGVMDGGAVLNLTPDALTFVAGGFIGDPAKVEAGLKKIVEVAKEEEDFPGIQWNAAQHQDVAFHTLSAPIPQNEKPAQQLFGETVEMAIGIGKDSVYFALGRNCVEKVKQVIDRSRANPGKAIAPMEMTFALGQIMQVAESMADEDDRPALAMIADMLKNEANGRDHVRIVVQPIENGQRTRIEAEEGVLRAIGVMIMNKQMAGAF
jgi:hypothetical protein